MVCVQTISAKHKAAVGNSKIDQATLKNIWHSKKEAWKGIDDILPTGVCVRREPYPQVLSGPSIFSPFHTAGISSLSW
jgi:hypothetical protein